jgi:hypothetical protein
MIRQLGKPTVFMSPSANEISWPTFLGLLNRLSGRFPGVSDSNILTRSRGPGHLLHYFHKLVFMATKCTDTFTCQKRGEKICRFVIPYWPMQSTRVLLMVRTDGRRKNLQSKEKRLREVLDNGLTTEAAYLALIRSTMIRPTLLFKRAMTQLFTNTFNQLLAGLLSSNMDLQFILDEYSCPAYVVKYVNNPACGVGN